MKNEQWRLNAWWGLRVALGLVLAGLLPLSSARAQAPTTPPGLQNLPDVPRAGAPDAGLVQTEVDVQRADGGFALQGAGDPDGGTQPRFEPPILLTDSPARYPEALAAQPVAGTVRLELLLDEQGEVAEARLLEGSHPLLNDAALHAAPGLRFSPAKVEGVPVQVRLVFEYRFEAPQQPMATAEQPLPPVTLRGLIRTKGNRKPVAGAVLVSDLAKDSPVETGPDGRFEARLPPGTQTVRITAPGHKPGAFVEDVRKGEALEVVYGLEPLVVNPYETVVRGDRERTEVSRVTLHDAELREIPGTMGDPFRVMMLMPGVSSMLSGISYPVVRGSQPASTGYFLDGIRVPILFHLFLGPAVIHPDFIDTIDFYAGNPSTQYGRLTGGAVEGKLTRPRDDRVHGSAYADFINAGLFIEYPFQSTGTNVSVAGRLSYTPWVIALAANALQPPGANDSKLVLDFYDYQARVEQEVGQGRLRLFAFGSSDTFGAEAKTDNGTTALQAILFHRLDLRYRHPVGGGELEAGVTLGLDRFAISNESPVTGGGTFNVDQRDVIARLGYERKLSEGVSLRSGLDVDHKRALVSINQRTRAEVGDPFDEVKVDLPVAIATFTGLWAELLWEKDTPWTLVPGVRLDNYHLAGGVNELVVEPRLSVRRKMSDALTLKGGVGLYHQPPTTLISVPVIDIAALDQGLQQALQISAGAEYKNLWGFDVSLDGYVNPMLRTVELTPFGSEDTSFETPSIPDGSGGNPGNGRPPPTPDPGTTGGRGLTRGMAQVDNPIPNVKLPDLSSHGLSYGLELLIRRPLGGNWFGWLSYSLQRSTRYVRFNRYDAHGQPVGQAEGDLPYVFDQTHVANLVLSYKFSNNITVGGVVHFNSGRPESGNLTSSTQTEGTDITGQPTWVRVDRDKVDRLPPFFRFDIRLSKAWAYDTFTLEAYLDMLNVTISQEVVAFDYIGGGGAPLRKSATGVPIVLPIFGLKGRY
ncbi:TonB family protein [Vitiosangium sp. GDMCC 1.1324]|uniref:TonB family protein n=1 Tax=Vitiosangium sp. (strain GDMCC 1.1324) TaxID=2138576 RepID=UPI000D35D76B|nr:TonB family protein [Vitiosangium sp. GDMCC 1.1324]PTL83236.1 energy transducer TonB [Vitiosangium sp. GDMCC 1.1324]